MNNSHHLAQKIIDVLCCPKCTGPVDLCNESFHCLDCAQQYPVVDNIPRFFWQHESVGHSGEDVTGKIKAFYEENPFPNYDDFDNSAVLIEKARQGGFAKSLDDHIPFGTRIIEIGCGTGQLTNFLSASNRKVIGTDICINSLKMAQDFKEKNGLDRATFLQMNLFKPCFKPGSFDLVICSGVLHHTSDPFLGFRTIADLVKPKGYIIIGLYHKYGRVFTDIRRFLFRISRDKFSFLDNRLARGKIGASKTNVWFADQYQNPHESKHTVGEVLQWLEKLGLKFLRSIPKTTVFERSGDTGNLFQPISAGNPIERVLMEFGMMFTGSKEGGFFIISAQKR